MDAKNQPLPQSVIKLVDPECLYQHVLALEGNRHPLPDFKGLNAAADYIRNEMQKINLVVSNHSFSITPYKDLFQNIEGIYQNHPQIDSYPVYYITAHYDTVQKCPGAVDNAGSIALMLECARILVENKIPGSFHFLAFSAEEFNPGWVLFRNQKLQELGLVDDRNRPKNLHISQIMKKYKQMTWRNRQLGLSPGESIQKTIRQLEESSDKSSDLQGLTPALREFFAFDLSLYQPFSHTSIWGNFALVGSERWVQDHSSRLSEISGVINIDAVGFNSSQISSHSQLHNSSQDKPHSHSNSQSQSQFKTQSNSLIHPSERKFPVQILANAPAKFLLDKFTSLSKNEDGWLELVPIYIPHEFEKIACQHPDLLRSDHTSFWKRNVPAVFLTDLNDVPNPFYHTPADSIQKLDFSLLTEYTKLVLQVLITN
ncbi:MAG: M28 family peptidase [Promethearchaeota archaeon]